MYFTVEELLIECETLVPIVIASHHRPPEDGSWGVLLLAWVPLAGEEDSESLSGIRDETRDVGLLAEDVGRVTVGCDRGGSSREESSSTSNRGQCGTSALRDACCCDETKRRSVIQSVSCDQISRRIDYSCYFLQGSRTHLVLRHG